MTKTFPAALLKSSHLNTRLLRRSSLLQLKLATLKSTTSPLTVRNARGTNIEEALRNQNALLKRRCDALESSVADLQRKIDASHLNMIVPLRTILER